MEGQRGRLKGQFRREETRSMRREKEEAEGRKQEKE